MAAPPVKEDFQKDLDELDVRLTALKVSYDKYFLGIEKFPPDKERAAVSKTILDLGNRFIRNTGHKFRRDTLKNKFLTYCRLWDRNLKEIEEGTFKPHKIKAELHERERLEREARKAARNGASPAGAANGNGNGAEAPAAAPAAAPNGNGNGNGAPAPAAPKADPIQRIFDQYVAAKKKANESTDGITPDKMATIIKQQTAALKQKYNCKSVEFRVVVEDGKAKLKAIPK
jgi:hypothetical protein